MVSKATVVFVCDSCGTEGDRDEIKNYTVKGNGSPGKGRTFDSCEVCYKPVQELLDRVKGAPQKIPA